MWAVFISAIGGLFWVGKIIADRISSNRADVDAMERRAAIERWEAQTVDRDLEYEIRANHAAGGIVKQCNEAILFIRSIPGLEEANFDLTSTKRSRYYVSMFLLYWQMVKHGKLPVMHNVELGNYLELSIDITLPKKSRVVFGTWVEQNLQLHGVDRANLYYTGRDRASFVWEPFVFDAKNVTRITDPDIESKIPGR